MWTFCKGWWKMYGSLVTVVFILQEFHWHPEQNLKSPWIPPSCFYSSESGGTSWRQMNELSLTPEFRIFSPEEFIDDASFLRFPTSSWCRSARPQSCFSRAPVHHVELHRSPPIAACRFQISSNPASPLICSSWTQALHSLNNSNNIEAHFFGAFECIA